MKKILVIIVCLLILILTFIRVDAVNHILWKIEDNIKIWDDRISGLRYEIKWIQDRIKVLENPISEPNVPTLPKPMKKVINVDNVMQSVVHIKVDAGWEGSGVYVGNGLILTAGHVVSDAYSFEITFENGNVYESNTVYLESVADVGFIYLENYDGYKLVFNQDSIGRGDSAYIFGNPFGWNYKFSVTKGIISSINRDCDGFFGEKIMLQSDAASWPGNSGGPITDDEGEIIGILVGGIWGSDSLSLCIPANICEQAMKTYLSILEMSRLK